MEIIKLHKFTDAILLPEPPKILKEQILMFKIEDIEVTIHIDISKIQQTVPVSISCKSDVPFNIKEIR